MFGFVHEIDISESDYPLTSVKVVMNLGFRIVNQLKIIDALH